MDSSWNIIRFDVRIFVLLPYKTLILEKLKIHEIHFLSRPDCHAPICMWSG